MVEALEVQVNGHFSALSTGLSCAVRLGHSSGKGIITKIDKVGHLFQIINIFTCKCSTVYESPLAKHWRHRSLFLHHEITGSLLASFYR